MTEREIDLSEFVGIKGWKALGNKLGEFKISIIEQTNKSENENGDVEPDDVSENTDIEIGSETTEQDPESDF